MMVTDTNDPKRHGFFMGQLRDSLLIHTPHFEVVQVIPAIEHGHE